MTTTERPVFNTGLGANFAPEILPNSVVIRRASTPSDFAAWLKVCQKHFPDTAQLTVDYIQEQARVTRRVQSQFWMMEEGGELVGVRWTAHIPGSPYASGIYGAIEEPYQGGGRYPRLMQESESFLIARGVSLITIECIDPFSCSDAEEARKAAGRIKYFTRHGYLFVDPSKVRYYRPDADHDRPDFAKTVQTGFTFGFKPLRDPGKFLDFRKGSPILSKSRFIGLYLASVHLETEIDVDTLRTQFSAVQTEFEEVDRLNASDVPLIWDPAAIPQQVQERSLTPTPYI
ncbi:MAG: GNAT family N-acetyltransferase [Candidatus Blackburnbacteria bacterium]|nr:GNAT family N-acetyltransferase [Candidatus Blackburnbacteria bacterium]